MRLGWTCVVAVVLFVQSQVGSHAQGTPGQVACAASKVGERTHCPADTSAGVTLGRSPGSNACVPGKTWGYDQSGIWVSDGCSGEFVLVPPASQQPRQPSERIETWSEFDPGDGFLIGRSSAGELSISGYALLRYLNQLPAEQAFTDHLGNEHAVDPRHDIFPHRIFP